MRRVHVRLLPYPCRHVDYITSVMERLSTERPGRRQPRAAEQMGSLQERCHREFKRHGYMPHDHTVLWGVDGYVLALDGGPAALRTSP